MIPWVQLLVPDGGKSSITAVSRFLTASSALWRRPLQVRYRAGEECDVTINRLGEDCCELRHKYNRYVRLDIIDVNLGIIDVKLDIIDM